MFTPALLLTLLAAQTPARTALQRLSFYSTETQGEVLVDLGGASSATVVVQSGGKTLATDQLSGPGVARAPFPLAGMATGVTDAICDVTSNAGIWTAKFQVVKLDPKPNEVKVDRLSGGLVADGMPFFPYGFYTYPPVQPTLAEEEFAHGFSMMSPYQDLHGPSADRHAYMDRCAALGMKVNYNLTTFSGGGSGANLSAADKAKRELLKKEILEFKDHPALLSWYLADEPDGQGISPAALEEEYQEVHQLDPYHPVLMVFNTKDLAPKYRNGLDVAMADPYPVPIQEPTTAGDTIAALRQSFGWDKPVWVAGQAFGGNELWSREPTPQEAREMTWQSILDGATGVQYFIRQGLQAFPKSPTMWAECERMAEEVFELTPFLLSGETVRQPRVDQANVQARCWHANGATLLALVNKSNAPGPVSVHLSTAIGNARLPFENRTVGLRSGELDDFIDAYGTRFYILDEKPAFEPDPANPMIDPSFELNPTAGVPSGCYIRVGTDRAATARVDPRLAHTGRHSVRLTAPSDGGGLVLAFYSVSLAPGKKYTFSVWGKAPTGGSATLEVGGQVGAGPLNSAKSAVKDAWTRCDFTLDVPAGTGNVHCLTYVRLASKGVAWIDDISILPAP